MLERAHAFAWQLFRQPVGEFLEPALERGWRDSQPVRQRVALPRGNDVSLEQHAQLGGIEGRTQARAAQQLLAGRIKSLERLRPKVGQPGRHRDPRRVASGDDRQPLQHIVCRRNVRPGDFEGLARQLRAGENLHESVP